MSAHTHATFSLVTCAILQSLMEYAQRESHVIRMCISRAEVSLWR